MKVYILFYSASFEDVFGAFETREDAQRVRDARWDKDDWQGYIYECDVLTGQTVDKLVSELENAKCT